MRGATEASIKDHLTAKVSIHAPHAGRDSTQTTPFVLSVSFNPRAPCGARQIIRPIDFDDTSVSIHAPHAGRDARCKALSVSGRTFQSTRPMRGATSQVGMSTADLTFQSTRPMRGATFSVVFFSESSNVSIHAPHAGRDPQTRLSMSGMYKFQSTRPMRGATSIQLSTICPPFRFNPRAPCGARHSAYRRTYRLQCFNPRAPCGARPRQSLTAIGRYLSFNPRAPCGARREEGAGAQTEMQFQSTRPMRGATIT